MQLIDGKATAAAIKAEIAEEVKRIVDAGGKRPHLAAILVTRKKKGKKTLQHLLERVVLRRKARKVDI